MTVDTLVSVINRMLPEPHSGLLAGLLFGSKASLPDSLYDALVTSGTLHIIALSGMNIAILARMVTGMLIPFIGKRWASLGTVTLVIWFVFFVGPSPSIVRAGIMGSISLLAVFFGRGYWAFLSWMIAVSGMVILNNSWLTDISFQLSASATLGIILFGGNAAAVPSRTEKIPGYIVRTVREDLRLTLSAQVFTIPLIFYYFHRVSLISPVANLLIGWVIAPLTGLGWGTVLIGSIWFPAGQILAWVDWIALEYLIRTVHLMSSIPFAGIEL